MSMAAPARSVVRVAMAAVIAATVVVRPGLAAAQSQEPETLIRDTEIEDIIAYVVGHGTLDVAEGGAGELLAHVTSPWRAPWSARRHP